MVRTVVIDGAGRIVIPKDIREEHQLHVGRRLSLVTHDGRLVLEAMERDDQLIEKDGLLLVGGEILEREQSHRKVREERVRDLVARVGPKSKRRRPE